MEDTLITQNEAPNRRRKVAKFALAGVAVLGVGASLTSAAWSDNVFFGGTAKAAPFELQGWDSVNNVWENADTSGAEIRLPTDAFDKVGPGIPDSHTVLVRNNGKVPIKLNAPVVSSKAGDLFSGSRPAKVTFGVYTGDGTLDPGEQESIDVIVTGDIRWTGTMYQGAAGTMTIQIAGESSPIVVAL